jgi:hypothetical protein
MVAGSSPARGANFQIKALCKITYRGLFFCQVEAIMGISDDEVLSMARKPDFFEGVE